MTAAAAADATPRDLRWAPGLAIAALVGLSFVPRVAGHATLAWSYRGAAIVLAVWFVGLLATGARRAFAHEAVIRTPHWVQGMVHSSIYLYWGWHWSPVYDQVFNILAQIAFAYAFTALWSWTRGRAWFVGFGVVPVVLSTNLFMWFKDDWYFLQFVVLTVGFLGKDLIQWEKDGRRTHIFNPSGFALSVVSVCLILTDGTGITWGEEIAVALRRPDYIYLEIFLLGLVVQWLFHVTLMTFAAAGTLWLLTAGYNLVFGVHFFVDTTIPIAVFLGLHLLVTDPSTSPRTHLGRIIFGGLYGLSVYVLYWGLDLIGAPTFYDKLLFVPLLNLLVQRIDAFAKGVKLPFEAPGWSRKKQNAAFMAGWAALFFAMSASHAVDREFEGTRVEFWDEACAEDRRNACAKFEQLLASYCESGSNAHCGRLAELMEEGKVSEASPEETAALYSMACEGGVREACMTLAMKFYEGRGVEKQPRAALNLYIEACQGGLPAACSNASAMWLEGPGDVAPDPRRAADALAKGCEAGGDSKMCAEAGLTLLSGRNAGRPIPPDKRRAGGLLRRACDGGDAVACANLGLMALRGDGVPADRAEAVRLHQRSCELGLQAACGRAAQLRGGGGP